MTFIALEGGEGVGKTTQMRLLKERLPILFPNQDFVFTREPGGTPFADKIREVILSDEAKHADGKTMFGLFAAARAEHLGSIVMPALVDGKVVVTDRFVAATYAYQVVAQHNALAIELFDEYFENLDAWPHLTIILDVDPEVAQQRVKARAGQDATHFDTRPIDFHLRLRDGYTEYARDYSKSEHKVVLVDASQAPEDIHEEVLGHLREIL